ncbi:MAG TPA: aldolase/citrate lyase family protein [Terriglobales bacterium]|nr:aldolase/citrate lyase family protein [Terriglobales bacterium]
MVTSTSLHKTAEAGRWGQDVRSDAHVLIEPGAARGLELVVESRVEAIYGEAIRAQAREVLQSLRVEDARVTLHDEGALPFVLAGRIEAAVRRSGPESGRRYQLPRLPLSAASARDRLRRSRLYLPGNEPKYFINAGLHAPDAVILDLEDSVHPAEKDAARVLVRNALRAVDFARAERMVRINPLPLGLADLDEVVPEGPDVILIPKVEHAEQVLEVERHVCEIQARVGQGRALWLMPILESALGVEHAFAIATASPRLCALTIGLEDYTADLGVARTPEGTESLFARQRMVNAARAAGVQAIDSVFSDVADMDGLRAWGRGSRALGFEGMGCIHPLQIAVIHEAFAPTAAEIEKAQRIVSAFEEAQAKGLGVVSLGSKMIDPPVVQRALKLVERARQMDLLPESKR